MVRIGLIGLGFMGRMHYAAYQKLPGVKLVAVADRDPKRAAGDLSGGWGNIEGAAEKLDMSGVRGTTDFNELLNMPEVEAVDICLPTPLHEEFIVAALAAGKHVICEKPLALSIESAERIAAAAAGAKGIFMPAMCMRFWPQWAWIKQAIADNRFGRVKDATFRRVASMPPGWFINGEMSGGAILDLHVHDTDFVFYCFGKPRAVFSRGYVGASGRIDYITTSYLYDDKVVTAEGGWNRADGFPFTMRATVQFENATVDHDASRERQLLVCRDKKAEPVDLLGDGYEAELAYFIECIRSGKRPGIVNADDAVTGLRILEAERKSVEIGQVIAL
jgi:predicted dehydrogenase